MNTRNRELTINKSETAPSKMSGGVIALIAGSSFLVLAAAGMIFILAIFLIFRSGSIVGRTQDGPVLPDNAARSGKEAPDFSLNDVTGKSVALSDFQGKRVLLNVWASWCPPCRAEMPDLEALHQKYDDLVVLAVNSGDDTAAVKEFVENFELSFPILIDENQQVSKLYKVRGLPTSFFIDSQGTLRKTHMGQLDASLAELYLKDID